MKGSVMRAWIQRWAWPALALLSGLMAMTALWITAALTTQKALGWMAWVLVIDLLILLHLSRAPHGWTRRVIATLGTIIGIACTAWAGVSAWFGLRMGLDVFESVTRMGPVLAQVFLEWWVTPFDSFFIFSAPVLAFLFANISFGKQKN
jgi:hypothetical protein